MKIYHKIKADLIRKGIPPRIHAVQDDALCRIIRLELTEDDRPWNIPDGAQVLIRYSKPDRTGGQYDTLPDGTLAWSARNHCLYLTLAPQVLTAPGTVELSVTMILGNARLTTFRILIDVQRHPAFSGISENYSYITAFLPQPAGGAKQGHYLRISEVDEAGNILALESVSSPGGFSQVSKAPLLELLRCAVYTQDVSDIFAALEQSFDGTEETVIPNSLTALYSGGSVPEGTALGYFLGKVKVTRYYSDGSADILSPSEYSVSGADIAVGTNILTVTDLQTGLTASFTVTGTAVYYSVATILKNATDGTVTNSTASVERGDSYTALVTIPNTQELVSITVTMGGTDISASCVSGANISIGAVTGDVVITVTAKTSEAVFYSVTKNMTNVTCSGAASVKENAAYTATLSVGDGYELQSVTVTMGGVDVTATVYANSTISIPSVTGDIVITAVAANSEIEVTMTGISVAYTGGDVAVGTEPQSLQGVSVTAHYSDGSTQAVDKYTMAGTISEGSNTIIVSYNGFTASFNVTGVETYPALCTVTNNMTNASTNNTLPGVAGGSYYTAKITADEGYALNSVTVSMGGEDVTSAVYDDSTGSITIETVTGDIVITAIAAVTAGILLSDLVTFEVGSGYIKDTTGEYTNDSLAHEKNRLSANIENVSFYEGDILTIGDYATYKFAISTTPTGAGNYTNWIGGGYQTADYTLTAEQAADMRILMVARNDNANITADDIAYINENAKVVRT